MTSISSNNLPTPKLKLWSILLWLAVWEAASRALNEPILCVSPVAVLTRLFSLARTLPFWQSILFSLSRIACGFFCGIFAGTFLAVLAARFKRISELFAPLVLLAKTIPVASFIILALIWIPSRNLSVFISFLMVMPVTYTNVLEGIRSTDKELLEMAQVFSLSPFSTIRYIYVSQVLPFFQSACSISLGLCWKSGIAAEVIGIPRGSIGENLYNAKIYINTANLFAWTFVIIVLSVCFEKLVLLLLNKMVKRLERI